MAKKIGDIVARMRRNPRGIRFRDLCQVCDFYFGEARQTGGSHRIYQTPWQGDPRVNIQDDQGMAKAYQVGHRWCTTVVRTEASLLAEPLLGRMLQRQ